MYCEPVEVDPDKRDQLKTYIHKSINRIIGKHL